MKKTVILIAIMCLTVGLRLHFAGISNCGFDGKYTVQRTDGSVTVFDSPQLVGNLAIGVGNAAAERIDFAGGIDEAMQALDNLDARLLYKEEFDSLTVLYAYSPRILKSEQLSGRKVNIMVAVGSCGVAIGSPLLIGSY